VPKTHSRCLLASCRSDGRRNSDFKPGVMTRAGLNLLVSAPPSYCLFGFYSSEMNHALLVALAFKPANSPLAP
jgi:hypothetical protein